jgi:hypothetical protein
MPDGAHLFARAGEVLASSVLPGYQLHEPCELSYSAVVYNCNSALQPFCGCGFLLLHKKFYALTEAIAL